jgi:PAS domain S-box-containing protein
MAQPVGRLRGPAQVLELAPDAIIVRDLRTSAVLFWNRGAEELYGWTKEEALGQETHTLLQTKFPVPLAALEAELVASGRWDGELIHRRKDGTAVVVASRQAMYCDEDGQPQATLEINTDISERKRAAETHALLAAIVESSQDAMITGAPDGLITSWNPAAERLFGYTAAEAVGQPAVLLLPPDRLEDAHNVRRVFAGETLEPFEARRMRKDGSLVDVSVALSPVRTPYGDIVSVSAVFRDVTERRAIDRMKDEFVSIVSHELRTPLTSIRGSLGLLASGVVGALPARGQRMIEIALSNTERLIRLINDILDLERMGSGLVGVRLDVAPLQARIMADPDRILQVLTNLLSNGIKFSARDSTVRLDAERVSDDVVVRVADQGRGIPVDKLESIFERFLQVDASDTRDKGGTGLGLAISRSIVEQHDGHIWAHSALGHGATFFIRLPLLNAAGPRQGG